MWGRFLYLKKKSALLDEYDWQNKNEKGQCQRDTEKWIKQNLLQIYFNTKEIYRDFTKIWHKNSKQ